MKIAVAKEGNMVAQHFGHCEGFEMFEIKDNQIVGREFVQSPPHQPGILPPFLAEKGANIIIAGGMGTAAVKLFEEKNIEVIIGVQGSLEDVIAKYLKGELKSAGSACEHHH